MALRGTGGLASSQPTQVTLHEVRGRRRHEARLHAFADMKEELKSFVREEIYTILSTPGYASRLSVIGEELRHRDELSRDAGQYFACQSSIPLGARKLSAPGGSQFSPNRTAPQHCCSWSSQRLSYPSQFGASPG